MNPLQLIGRRALSAIAIASLGAVLASCGRNHHDDEHGGSPPPAPAADAFIAAVTQQVVSQDDNAEPVSVDAFTITTPEATEPQSVPSP